MQHVMDMRVVKMPAGCGAFIEGVDLSRDMTPEEFAFVKKAWDENLVLVFRGQNISEDAQLRFASRFGPLGDRKIAPDKLKERSEGVKPVSIRSFMVWFCPRPAATRFFPICIRQRKLCPPNCVSA